MSIKDDIANHPAYIQKIKRTGGAAMSQSGVEPGVDAGLFDYPEWAVGVEYKQNALFMYDGQPGFVRQAHTSQAQWKPFATGTESIYGARPRQGPDGVYPYVYNMKSEVGMRVRSVKDNAVYAAIQPADPLLYDPADVPALFEKEETEE